MTKLTIEVPDEVARRLADAAAEQGIDLETLARHVLAESFPPRRAPGLIALGRSTSGRRAAW